MKHKGRNSFAYVDVQLMQIVGLINHSAHFDKILSSLGKKKRATLGF
jgi:hypothetical protein